MRKKLILRIAAIVLFQSILLSAEATPPTPPIPPTPPAAPVVVEPHIQMLVPGFTVRELPVSLTNINNVRYRSDGKLVALGYNGRIWLLSDTDGDGLEDTVKPFWDPPTLSATIGMALTPKDDPRGDGVFVAGKGRISLFLDKDHTGRATEEITVATGWEKLKHAMDAVGLDVASDGTLYFGLGCADYANAYQIDKATGAAHYRLESERGTIQKVSPDFKHRETICTGIRWPVSLRFNAGGDLFCTDQEGATWMPNGNPFDELLNIRLGESKSRHYGFPPRHPKHLPNVIDEPSVFDYAPQHQSTCGMNFNESVNGGPVFGPACWKSDVLIAGESRGKIYRTKLVKTAAGYVAQNQLIACLNMLTLDVCVSPNGDLIVVTHGGKPDWGSGPQGKGRIFKISYTGKDMPQPVAAWSASATELRVSFDRPLDSAQLRNLTKQTTISAGQYASAGDRFEVMRPGYAAVKAQQMAPRETVPVLSANVSADGRTLLLRTPPLSAAVNYGITLPGLGRPAVASGAEIAQQPAIDVLADLNGVSASWRSKAGDETWSGWLPHADLAVSGAFTQASAEHERLRKLLQKPGVLKLNFRLDLSHMLQPMLQPGTKLDYDPPGEDIVISFASDVPFALATGGHALKVETAGNEFGSGFSISSPKQWQPFEVELPTGTSTSSATPSFHMTWNTVEDTRPRPFPLRRFLLPWASSESGAKFIAERGPQPEIAGGSAANGRELFYGKASCSKCHEIRGEGGKIGPDLSNLIYRDYESVLKDIREPSAAINPDFVSSIVSLTDGRMLSGMVVADSKESLSLADSQAIITQIPRDQVKSMKTSPLSLMPEGLADALTKEQLRDVMTFLLTDPAEKRP